MPINMFSDIDTVREGFHGGISESSCFLSTFYYHFHVNRRANSSKQYHIDPHTFRYTTQYKLINDGDGSSLTNFKEKSI